MKGDYISVDHKGRENLRFLPLFAKFLFGKREYTYFHFFMDIIVYVVILIIAFSLLVPAICPCFGDKPNKQSSSQNGTSPGDKGDYVIGLKERRPEHSHLQFLPNGKLDIAERDISGISYVINSVNVVRLKLNIVFIEDSKFVMSLFRNSIRINLRQFSFMFIRQDLSVF